MGHILGVGRGLTSAERPPEASAAAGDLGRSCRTPYAPPDGVGGAGRDWGATVRIGVPRETRDRETRVAATPTTVGGLTKLGWTVVVEPGAGERSSFPDDAYTEAGAELGDPWGADVVFAINTPRPDGPGPPAARARR